MFIICDIICLRRFPINVMCYMQYKMYKNFTKFFLVQNFLTRLSRDFVFLKKTKIGTIISKEKIFLIFFINEYGQLRDECHERYF
jgi:hypothetical protein